MFLIVQFSKLFSVRYFFFFFFNNLSLKSPMLHVFGNTSVIDSAYRRTVLYYFLVEHIKLKNIVTRFFYYCNIII